MTLAEGKEIVLAIIANSKRFSFPRIEMLTEYDGTFIDYVVKADDFVSCHTVWGKCKADFRLV